MDKIMEEVNAHERVMEKHAQTAYQAYKQRKQAYHALPSMMWASEGNPNGIAPPVMDPCEAEPDPIRLLQSLKLECIACQIQQDIDNIELRIMCIKGEISRREADRRIRLE